VSDDEQKNTALVLVVIRSLEHDEAQELSTVQRMALIVLAQHAGLKYGSRPGDKLISRMSGVHVDTVPKLTKQLVELGWITKLAVGTGRHSTTYGFNVERIHRLAAEVKGIHEARKQGGHIATGGPGAPPSNVTGGPSAPLGGPQTTSAVASDHLSGGLRPPKSHRNLTESRTEEHPTAAVEGGVPSSPTPEPEPSKVAGLKLVKASPAKPTHCPRADDPDLAAWLEREGIPAQSSEEWGLMVCNMLAWHRSNGRPSADWSSAWLVWKSNPRNDVQGAAPGHAVHRERGALPPDPTPYPPMDEFVRAAGAAHAAVATVTDAPSLFAMLAGTKMA
jgi:hypothetical protein